MAKASLVWKRDEPYLRIDPDVEEHASLTRRVLEWTEEDCASLTQTRSPLEKRVELENMPIGAG